MVVFFKMISSLVICVFQICPVQSLHHLKSQEVLPSEKVASMSFVIQKAGKVREWNGIPHIINTTIDFLSWSRSRAGERSHKHDSCLFHNDVFFSIVRISSLVSYYSTTDNIIQLIVDFRHILLAHDDDDLSLPAGCREAANCRYCFYSQAKNQVFRPAGATRCTDSGQTLQDRRAPVSAWLCKMWRLSV